tara:strand:+ start:6342 stop:7100 length:759 start_codon:yes stop_codon:yes gene_type:complete
VSNETKTDSLMVCTPVHSDVSMHYMKACLDLQKECLLNKINISFNLMKSSLVTQGRNLCVSNFMTSPADRMLFIDSDIEFSTRSVFRLLNSPHDVSLIPYPMKTVDPIKFKKDFSKRHDDDSNTMGHVYPITVPDPNDIRPKDGFIEITKGPAGMMMIKRSVFERLEKEYSEFNIVQKTMVNGELIERPHYFNFFDSYYSPKTKTYTGEDFYFCKLWTSIGGKIYALIDEYINHIGEYSYRGRFNDDFTKIE